MTNQPNGTLYVGVTTNLVQRVWQRRGNIVKGFTDQYGLKRLVFHEEHATIAAASQREKHQALAACLESSPDFGVQSFMGRPV